MKIGCVGADWNTVEHLILVHAILKGHKSFSAVSKVIRQTGSISVLLSHKASFFTSKVRTDERVVRFLGGAGANWHWDSRFVRVNMFLWFCILLVTC